MSNARPIFILGMHRSGTSCLSGCLENMGLRFGHVNRAARYNPKGNMEDASVYRLNDAVLANTGCSWDNPPESGLAVWTDETRVERDGIISRYESTGGIFGWKDPRFVLTLDGWLERFPDASFVGTVRHPAAVARSLANRGGLTFESGLALWFAYNNRLLEIVRQHDLEGRMVSFDASDAEYVRQVVSLGAGLGLQAREEGSVSFFEQSLRANATNDWSNVPETCKPLYDELLSFTV